MIGKRIWVEVVDDKEVEIDTFGPVRWITS